jgi:putative ABC transport system permease protein
MNAMRLVLAYLKNRALGTGLNVLLLALGVATIVVLVLFASQAEKRLRRDSPGIDLVIGAKGSPMQLILSSIYHLDLPNGNIPLSQASPLIADPMVKRAIPLALGDSVRGFRIVGTTAEYLDLYSARLEHGRMWKAPLEAVLGAQVARATGLKVGATFSGSHGLAAGGPLHNDAPYQVVGVLAPTDSVVDRLVLTSLESIWKVHAGHGGQSAQSAALANMIAALQQPDQRAAAGTAPDRQEKNSPQSDGAGDQQHAEAGREVTAFLIQYATPLAAAVLPRRVNAQSALQAASPAYETARLLSMLGVGIDTLRAFALVLMAAAALGIFIALSAGLEERRHDLALLRVLGASQRRIFLLVVLEGVTLAAAGVILGLVLGHLGAQIIGGHFADARQVSFTGWAWVSDELWLVLSVLLLGLTAALIPALRAYHSDIALTLSQR